MEKQWTRSVAPVLEPVTLAEAKSHLRVTTVHEDSLVTAFLKSAREQLELYCWRGFMTQTWILYLDGFPVACEKNPHASVWLPMAAPLVSITSVAYTEPSGTAGTLTENTDFLKDTAEEPGRIYPVYNESWPTVRDAPKSVVITYVCGWTAATAVPESIKAAIRFQATHWFENRGELREGLEGLHPTAKVLANFYRLQEFQ